MSSIPTPAKGVSAWSQFAAKNKEEGDKKDAAMAESMFKLWETHPQYLIRTAAGRMPEPIRFYGPGPDAKDMYNGVKVAVGTLYYARYKIELAGVDDPDGEGYYHEDHPKKINGRHTRPTYTTKHDGIVKELNPFRWQVTPAFCFEGVKTFPGKGTTKTYHHVYILNDEDFDETDGKRDPMSLDLDNRQGESLDKMYPHGHKLLKKFSTKMGDQKDCHPEWVEGQCLGPDPNNEHALRTHLGW